MSLQHLLRAAKVTSDMIERRDFMRRVWGDQYAERVRDAKMIVLGVATEKKVDIVEAGLVICEQAERDGQEGAVNLVIAAVVDLCEEGKP